MTFALTVYNYLLWRELVVDLACARSGIVESELRTKSSIMEVAVQREIAYQKFASLNSPENT